MRSSNSSKPREFTTKQFVQRQRMRHSVALWRQLARCYPMFTEAKSAYNGFLSLANHLPAVFVNKNDAMNNPSFLMPGIPVSSGTLPEIRQRLGEVDGKAALIADIRPFRRNFSMDLRLFTAEQTHRYSPRVEFDVRSVTREELVETGEGLALVGEEFADDNKGWALVMVKGDKCSSQSIVTRCKLYEQFTTEEAKIEAAMTYSGKKRKFAR